MPYLTINYIRMNSRILLILNPLITCWILTTLPIYCEWLTSKGFVQIFFVVQYFCHYTTICHRRRSKPKADCFWLCVFVCSRCPDGSCDREAASYLLFGRPHRFKIIYLHGATCLSGVQTLGGHLSRHDTLKGPSTLPCQFFPTRTPLHVSR